MPATIIAQETPEYHDIEYLSDYLSPRQIERLLQGQPEAVVRGPVQVVPHAQALCDRIEDEGWANSFGTYYGHDPDPSHATDIFIPIGSPLHDTAAVFIAYNLDYYGGDYVISEMKIFNPEVAPYWRQMADRGSPTANHMDHIHVSYLEGRYAQPSIPGEDDVMSKEDIDAIKSELVYLRGLITNIYSYLFNDRKGEDRGGGGLDNADLQTNDAVNTIRADVKSMLDNEVSARSFDVNEDRMVDKIVQRLKKDLRGIA